MDADFGRKLAEKIDEFQTWAQTRSFRSVRLVQYCGPEMIGAIDVSQADVPRQIDGLIQEGFYVDWSEFDGRLYLRVWEFGSPEPDWQRVYAELPLDRKFKPT